VPIYEYRCSTCGFQKEYLQKVNAPLLSVCPECSKETFGKMLTAAGFQLKGGGWYATDFKHSGAKPTSTKAGESADSGKNESITTGSGEGTSKSESKGDSKSDGKTEAKPAAAATAAATSSTTKVE